MVLLTATGLYKSYTQRQLLEDGFLSVESGDKIGIIGVNGTGKTTLLRILAGEETADEGKITRSNGLRVGYLQQNPVFPPDATILEQVLSGVSQKARDTKEYQCKSILTKLELTDFEAKIHTLSGGQRKRVALASALVSEVELLILDEPTNHIDSEMVSWLEEYLKNYKGALIMVTHDRYFLDRVTNRIVELDKGKLFSYSCNYTKFLQLKAQREDMAAANERKRQSLIRKEVEWILQGPCARGTKSQYRIDRLEKLKNQSVNLEKSSVELSSIKSRLGRKTIEIQDISKGYGDKKLFEGFSYNLLRDDRIGIIGCNGAGKSTFLRLIMGLENPDKGEISLGETVKIGYFSQECEDMSPTMRPIDYVKDVSDAIQTVDGVLSATQMLEKFLFFADLQYTTISRLSGGERRRLYLLKILISAPNILILDEPTNDLDIETLTILEDYLSTFSGAVLMVSHDRYFLDKSASKIFSFENGGIKIYNGGYTDYLIQKEEEEKPTKKPAEVKQTPVREKSQKVKFSFNEMREFETIDEDIAALEEKIEKIDAEFALSASDFVKLQELTEEKEDTQRQLNHKLERWVYLNELNDTINGADR
ncbi:MAG: ABC-F family ATP-binding cassette domain-containing protein [Oscillospiraceae bacterium]